MGHLTTTFEVNLLLQAALRALPLPCAGGSDARCDQFNQQDKREGEEGEEGGES